MKAYRIAMYKNERDNVRMDINVDANDAYSDQRVAVAINTLLAAEGLTDADVISVTADYTNMRDRGSWDIYIFTRDPIRIESEGETIFRLLMAVKAKHEQEEAKLTSDKNVDGKLSPDNFAMDENTENYAKQGH